MEEKMIGLIIKKTRKKLGFTCSQFANKCSYSRTYICQIENGNVEVSESVYIYLFKNLELDYNEYNKQNNRLEKVLEQILNSILFDNLEYCKTTIFENGEDYQYFSCYPKYLLTKFVYYSLNEIESAESIVKQIDSYFQSLSEYYKQVYLTYLAMYRYKETSNVNETLDLLKRSIEVGEFVKLTGVTLAYLSDILYNNDELLLSYIVNCKAEKKLLLDGNWNVYYKNKIIFAKIIAQQGDYEYSLKIFFDIVKNFNIDQAIKDQIEIEMAYNNFKLQRYEIAETLLDGKNEIGMLIKMCILIKQNKFKEFTIYYENYFRNTENNELKTLINVFYYKMIGCNNGKVYYSLLVDLSKIKSFSCEILTKKEIYDELIRISVKNKRYKDALFYLEEKNKEKNREKLLSMLTYLL